ncbi:type IV pilus modification PilV family protein [Zhaonella formicivorans]|uniref:type IV pilus modification PilV family protein n=1 Tax=Zhaonella formicivorans TaxID=2528593 RepID=UPI0010F045ED|nr:prepilin-type N-terminal cleavage/methylation domain-containing protein [Zhaonella formicivorans]
MFRQVLKEERGFTLVELMIAVIIMSVALIPMFSMFDFAVKSQQQGEMELHALYLSQGKMEELLADYYQNKAFLTPEAKSEQINGYTVSTYIGVPSGNLQEIQVAVSYTFHGKQKKVSLTTKVVEYP